MALHNLSVNGANLEYRIDGALQFSTPLASFTDFTVNGTAANDTLEIVGLIALAGGITFNGGAQSGSPGDTLVVQAGAVSSATVNFTNANDGSVVLTSGATSATYNFTGLEPVDMTGTTTADQVFNLPGGSNAQLEDDGTTGNNISQIRDTLGGFETTTFTHPTNSLTINGTTDNVTVNLADTLGTIGLAVNVGGTTTFTSFGTPSTPLASVTTDAPGTTSINTSAITTTGAQTYNDAVTLGSDTALTSTGSGAIAFNSTVDGAQTLTASTGGTVTFGAAVGGGIALTALGISASTVSFTGTNNVGTLAANLTGGGLIYTDADALNIGTAGTVSGISAASLALTTGGNITQSAGSVTVSGATTLNAGLSNDITLNNASNDFGGAVSITNGHNVTLRDLNAIDLGNSTVSGSLTVTASGAITDSGALAVTGTTALAAGVGNDITLNNASNDFGGAVTILAAEDVTLQDANAIALAATTVQSLSVTAATNITLGNLDTTTGLTVNAGGATTASGTISGAGGLTQAGGVTTLSAINSYTGATTINAGTLLVNGSIASSVLTTVSAGTLGGTNGTVGAVNVASGGTLSPGASAGILTANGVVTFTAGANFNVEIGGTTAGVDYDRLVAGDSVSLAGATLNASLLGSPVVGTIYTIIDKTSPGLVSGTFAGLADGGTVTVGGQAFQISYAGGDGNDVTLSLGALKVSGTDPIAVLADVSTTTDGGFNVASPAQTAARHQILNGDIIGTVNAGVTVNGFGLNVSTSKSDGTVDFTNNGAIVLDDAAADGSAALVLNGNGGGVHYSGTGTIANHASTPNSDGLLISSTGGIGSNLVEVAGSITGETAIRTADGTTQIVVSGAVTGTSGTAIVFSAPSSNNVVDIKTTAVITGVLDGSGNDDTVRLSGTGSGTFDLGKVGADFSSLQKGEAATWTVTGTLDPAVGTVIGNGTLLVDGTLGTVLVTDGFGNAPAAVLGGTGTVGNVTVQSLGVLAPGASAGTLTSSGDVTFATGSIFRVEIGGTTAGSQYDVLHLSGTGLSGFIDLGSATIQASLIGGFTPTVGQVFKIIDNDDTDAVSNTFAGMSEGAGVLVSGQAFRISYVGGDGNDVTLTSIVGGSNPPSLTGFGPSVEIEQAGPAAVPQVLDGDVVFTDPDNNFNSGTLAVSGLLAEDTVSVLSLGFDPGQFLIDDVAGPVDDLYFEGVLIGGISGGTGSTLNVTFNANANANAIDALIQNLIFLDSASNPTFSRTLSLNVTDAGAGSTGANPITVKVFDGVIETGGAGDDSFTITGNAHIDAGAGDDTVTFGFRLVDASVSYSGNQVIIDGPSIHTVLSGFEKFVFTDGTVDNNDGDRLVDDLFYYSRYHDIWNAHVEADTHYHVFGWHEGRDPNAFFSTGIYLGANPDVKAAGVDPLSHFDSFGWQEGRVPSLNFDPAQYLAANPDVAAAHIDPLRHFLEFGAAEGRQPFTPSSPIGADGFDYYYYLQHNPDVAAAGIDPFQHFQQFGWHEGRNPNALFDLNGYLATYADVAAAGINPLEHFHQFGWKEGRDPSVNFDTSSYLAAYADVAAANIDPLVHFLTFGQHEGRSAFADGVWG